MIYFKRFLRAQLRCLVEMTGVTGETSALRGTLVKLRPLRKKLKIKSVTSVAERRAALRRRKKINAKRPIVTNRPFRYI